MSDLETALRLGLAILAVVAIGIAAGTIGTAIDGASGDGDGGPVFSPEEPAEPEDPDGSMVLTALLVLFAVATIAIIAIYVLYGAPRLKSVILLSLVMVGFVLIVATAMDAVQLVQPEAPANQSAAGEALGLGEDDGEVGEPDATPTPVGRWLYGLLVVVVAASVVALLYGRGSLASRGSPSAEHDPEEEADTLAEMGAIARETADRIESARPDLENEIYRAWVEMTSLLEVDDPETRTPGEFAAEARRAGMAAEDVAALTELFERVRYGHRAATAERESRALEVLRRIESTYATDEGSDGEDDSRRGVETPDRATTADGTTGRRGVDPLDDGERTEGTDGSREGDSSTGTDRTGTGDEEGSR